LSLSKNVKIKIYKTIIFPVFYMGVKLGLDVKGRAQIEGVWEQGAK
jgi:hypothetical protein